MYNNIIEELIIQEIRAGDTAFEFKVIAENSALLSLLLQEAYLQREKKQTMSDEAFIELSEHLFENVDAFKDHKFMKGVEVDTGLERLLVTRKRFPKTLQEFADARYEKFKAAADEAKEKDDSEKAAEEIENLKSDLKSLDEVKKELEMTINAKSKGQRGEREVIQILQPIIDKVFEDADELNADNIPALQRNVDQVRGGGYDIVGIDFLALEVKCVETLALDKWFEQTKSQAGKDQHPVLLYKQKRKGWRVVMFGFIPCGNKKIRTNVNIEMSAFIVWFETMLKQSLGLITE